MKISEIPKNEPARLRDLFDLKVLDTEAEPQFDEIASMASLRISKFR